MPRLKMLSILAGTIATLALSAVPASAEFTSTAKPAQTQGEGRILKSAEIKDEGATITCPPSEINAQWHIQAKGQIKQQQIQATKGPHLLIQVKSWGSHCKSTIAGSELNDEIKPCGFQAVQRGNAEASGGVSEACVIKAGSPKAPICEQQIPVGMETAKESDQGINVGLEGSTLENFGANLIAKGSLNGGGKGQLGHKGYVVQAPGHPLCPIKTNEEGEIVAGEVEAIGLNA